MTSNTNNPSEVKALQQQLEAMQILLAHHEVMHQEMEKTLINLTQKIDDLQSRYQVVVKLMQSMQKQQIKRPDEEIPPPHY